MGQSCRCTNFLVKFVFINPTYCVGRGVRLFQGRFCAYAKVINEAPELARSIKYIWWRIVELHFVHLCYFPDRQPKLIYRSLTSKIKCLVFVFRALALNAQIAA